MRRSVLRSISVALMAMVLAVAPVFAKAGASITAGDGEYHFAQQIATFDLVASWNGKNGNQSNGYWARADCYANSSTVVPDGMGIQTGDGLKVYAQFQSITTTVQQGGWAFGPTPSWSGGGADCTLQLLSINNGVFSTVASDTFTVLP